MKVSPLERYRPSMTEDVLHSWAEDAQERLDELEGHSGAAWEPINESHPPEEMMGTPTWLLVEKRAGGKAVVILGVMEMAAEMLAGKEGLLVEILIDEDGTPGSGAELSANWAPVAYKAIDRPQAPKSDDSKAA